MHGKITVEHHAAIDIDTLVNVPVLTRFQKSIVALCFAVVAMDGMDIALMGFIAPALRSAWSVSDASMGWIIGAALMGLTLGALGAGPLADRFGRRRLIISSVLFFALCTLITALAQSVQQMMLLRFLTGLGLGAAMPNVSTLVAEYVPVRRRAFLITVVFCGFTCGAALGGFAASWLIPRWGWQAVLLMGGILPLLLLPYLVCWLPESLRFLLIAGAPLAQQRRLAQKLTCASLAENTRFFCGTETRNEDGSLRLVISPAYRTGTLLLCGSYFMGLFLVYLIGSWLPTLIRNSGMNVSQAALITALYQAGGTVGSLFAGWLMDRIRPHVALAAQYGLGAIATAAVGFTPDNAVLMGAIACCSGFCLNGANTGMNALSASYYPTQARATGSSWMHGIGRIGAILSAFAGAGMLAAGWTLNHIFLMLAVPALLTTLMLLLMQRYAYRQRPVVTDLQ